MNQAIDVKSCLDNPYLPLCSSPSPVLSKYLASGRESFRNRSYCFLHTFHVPRYVSV